MVRHQPSIEFHGPVAIHNQACAVYWLESAVYEFGDGAFHPSWKAQERGWRLVHCNRLQLFVLKLMGLTK